MNPIFKNVFNYTTRLVIMTSLVFVISCGGRNESSVDDEVRALQCPSVEKSFSTDEIEYLGGKGDGRLQFSDLRDSINSACMNCHQAPAQSGGFTYIDSYKGEVRTIAGKTQFFPGFSEIAEQAAQALLTSESEKKMPPEERRSKNPESFINLGKKINAWIASGKPEGSFYLDSNSKPDDSPKKPRFKNSQAGNCIPASEIIGFDYLKDRQFSSMEKLPQDLSDTDLFSIDAFELAKKGTVAYSVEYPLWTDNSNKGRWIHLPMKIEGLKLVRQKIKYDSTKNYFDLPENTRLYKFFYKKIKMANGKFRFRRVETRIIVVRKPWNKSLFGTYKWNESEQSATLVETPYRDGTPFKDTLFNVTTDEMTNKVRPYAIPGSQRCIDCHMGSEGRNFVIGFSPLQLNRRQIGYGGHEDPVSKADITQIERFIKYGFFENAPDVSQWPKLENLGSLPPKNEFELKASGYTLGNCSYCHNPNGLAFTKENGINLDLTAGALFGFNTKIRSTQIPSRLLVHQNGDLDQSHIWRKISDTSQQLGLTSQMPMNSAGGPDCKALRVIGKWIRSFESDQAAEQFEPSCKSENQFKWIDQDFTVVASDYYVPRRPDWNIPLVGMPDKFKNIPLTEELKNAINKKIAVGYWNKKESCQFPNIDLPNEDKRPWMMRGQQPKRPFGEIYYSTPGAWYFKTSCMKCHGENADGNSALARGILQWSGGSVRVADLVNGMFGKGGKNLKTFDSTDNKNYAPQYLFWMAMEGTRVQFPYELSSYLGKHGAQMLNQLREKCLNQISTNKTSTSLFMDHEIFNKVCFINNLNPGHPDLAFDPNTNKALYPEKVDAWLDQASFNIGYSIFSYLKDLSSGTIFPSNDQCEILYPKKEGVQNVSNKN